MSSNVLKLTKKQLKVLKQYADTSDSNYMQGMPGASELWHPWGYLDWHGSQYGTNFYSINAAGTAALLEHEPNSTRQSTEGEQT